MVVRMRNNRSQTKQRRSHHGLKEASLSTCKNCGALHRPHHMCLDCGFYNGRQVMDLTAEKQKREARLKAKKEMIAGANTGNDTKVAPKDTTPEPAHEEKPQGEAHLEKTPPKGATVVRDK